METSTTKEEIVVIHDSRTNISTTVSTKPIPAVIEQTYIQQQTLVTGEVLYTSNSVQTLSTQFQDVTVVMSKVQ
jgi:hypothetical protein